MCNDWIAGGNKGGVEFEWDFQGTGDLNQQCAYLNGRKLPRFVFPDGYEDASTCSGTTEATSCNFHDRVAFTTTLTEATDITIDPYNNFVISAFFVSEYDVALLKFDLTTESNGAGILESATLILTTSEFQPLYEYLDVDVSPYKFQRRSFVETQQPSDSRFLCHCRS